MADKTLMLTQEAVTIISMLPTTFDSLMTNHVKLRIEKLGVIQSENIFGNLSDCAQW